MSCAEPHFENLGAPIKTWVGGRKWVLVCVFRAASGAGAGASSIIALKERTKLHVLHDDLCHAILDPLQHFLELSLLAHRLQAFRNREGKKINKPKCVIKMDWRDM